MEYIVENFANLNQLLRATERPYNAVFARESHDSERTSDYGFYKTNNYAEAIDLLKGGYAEPLNQIKRGVETKARGISVRKTAVKNDVVGYAPNVPNAIRGIPQSMINAQTAAKKSKVLSIVYDVTGSGMLDSESYIKAGITICTIINTLEANGYRVSLKVIFKNSEKYSQRTIAAINLKDWRQPLDLKKLTFPLCHPSMQRRLGFKWLETQPDLTDTGYQSGYGRSSTAANSYDRLEADLRKNKVLGEHDRYITIYLCKDNDFDPQKTMKACGLE